MTERKTRIALDEAAVLSLKPFRLVKFFSYSGLVVFMIFTMALSWFISNYARNVLLNRSEAYSLVVSENLSHQVFQQFVLPTIVRYGKIALRNPDQFKRLDSIVRNATHGMRIQSVTIFDSKENIISYSTEQSLIGKEEQGGIEYEKALKGESNSVVESTGTLVNLFPGAAPISSRLHTFIPFKRSEPYNQNTENIMGVIEVVQDLSEDQEAIIQLQATIILASILIMSALFAVLRVIVARAERIIEARAAERSRLEQKLSQSERLAALGKMVASVSHEIKNPLGIVRSTADILGKRLKTIAPGNEHLANIIVEETGRLDGIVREFLDFARPQEPKFALGVVNDVLEKVLRFMEPELENKKITLVMELDKSLDPVYIDREQLYRACLNILVNSLQAMPEGGTLTVVSRKKKLPPAGVEIIITDSGIGMSEDKMKHIFSPFYTDKNRGTGLGLAIVKNIIDIHHGEISVRSKEGEGATFSIILPRG